MSPGRPSPATNQRIVFGRFGEGAEPTAPALAPDMSEKHPRPMATSTDVPWGAKTVLRQNLDATKPCDGAPHLDSWMHDESDDGPCALSTPHWRKARLQRCARGVLRTCGPHWSSPRGAGTRGDTRASTHRQKKKKKERKKTTHDRSGGKQKMRASVRNGNARKHRLGDRGNDALAALWNLVRAAMRCGDPSCPCASPCGRAQLGRRGPTGIVPVPRGEGVDSGSRGGPLGAPPEPGARCAPRRQRGLAIAIC